MMRKLYDKMHEAWYLFCSAFMSVLGWLFVIVIVTFFCSIPFIISPALRDLANLMLSTNEQYLKEQLLYIQNSKYIGIFLIMCLLSWGINLIAECKKGFYRIKQLVIGLVLFLCYLYGSYLFLVQLGLEQNPLSMLLTIPLLFYCLLKTWPMILLVLLLFTLFVINKILVIRQNKTTLKRLPVVGIPDQEKISVQLLLFRIRCAETAMIYSAVREWQFKANDGNWVNLFLKDYFELKRVDCCGESPNKSKLEQLEEKFIIEHLLDSKFNFDEFYNANYKTDILDFEIALATYCSVEAMELIKCVKTFGFFDNTILALLEEYTIFTTGNRKIFNMFILDKGTWSKEKIIRSYCNIESIWNEIISAFKSSIFYMKLNAGNDQSGYYESLLMEIDALMDLRRGLSRIIKEKNANHKNSLMSLDVEEKLIREQVEKHKIWNIRCWKRSNI